MSMFAKGKHHQDRSHDDVTMAKFTEHDPRRVVDVAVKTFAQECTGLPCIYFAWGIKLMMVVAMFAVIAGISTAAYLIAGLAGLLE